MKKTFFYKYFSLKAFYFYNKKKKKRFDERAFNEHFHGHS